MAPNTIGTPNNLIGRVSPIGDTLCFGLLSVPTFK
jgi:hypothetical protein